MAPGRLPITPSTADLLDIVLHALGEVEVNDRPHVPLVKAHSKGDGGHNDHLLPPRHHPSTRPQDLLCLLARSRHEFVLGNKAVPLRLPGVIRVRVEPPNPKLRGQLVSLVLSRAVDDDRVAVVEIGAFQERVKSPLFLDLEGNGQSQVSPQHGALDHPFLGELKGPLQCLLSIPGEGRGQPPHAIDTNDIPDHLPKLEERGTKVVRPLRGTVNLVNAHKVDPGEVWPLEQVLERLGLQLLW